MKLVTFETASGEQRIGALEKIEVLHQVTVWQHRLSAYASATRPQIVRDDVGHQSL